MVSFSDEGFHDAGELVALLRERGDVAVLACPIKRYVGAQIGIHNPSGERVGEVSHLRNTELLFVVGDGAAAAVDSLGADPTAVGATPTCVPALPGAGLTSARRRGCAPPPSARG